MGTQNNWKDNAETLERTEGKLTDLWRRFRSWRARRSALLVAILDMVVLFFIAEALNRFTAGSVYFKSVDVRLIFIFLIATMHGLRAGVIAGLLECAVLVFQYSGMGIYSLQLFYNVENWIPFVLYIVTGAITGYYANLRSVEIKSVQRENQLQREKYLFLDNLYRTSTRTNEAYRRQILGFEDSYGKIYQAVCRMDCPTVQGVCNEAGQVLAELLENPTALLYELSPEQRAAQAVSPQEDLARERQSFGSSGNMEKLFACMAGGEVWVNRKLLPEVPMFAEPVAFRDARGRTRVLLIVVWETEPDQMSEYYANRIHILGGLMEKALEKAALQERQNGIPPGQSETASRKSVQRRNETAGVRK